MVKATYGDVGLPAFEPGIEFGGTEELFSGDSNPVTIEDFPVAANAPAIPAFSVVGVNGAGNLALATFDKTVQAIGYTTHPTAVSASVQRMPIVRGRACLNPAALNWDPSFDTLEKKLAAFRGAPSPTNLLVRPRL